ncbi:hypothetical protein SAMIE_1034370 [Sphingobium amiense]|uniref:Uncharacterized protein n=1 Tax=Sphingobium amiense TaxID=135719 RepID=A0A494W9C5_9SPHN|nr:hypothetical protein [Sphingobium amiense]BBD99936.1 hypothetical protein SAMIE_1034370 [Sphingobium amiense]
MNIFWKGAAAITLAVAGLGAAAVPAQAQYYGGGWRDGRDARWDGRRDHRRWDDRRDWRHDRGWRGNRHGWRNNRYAYRQRCWTEWRYDYYRDRDVRVRICR